MPWVQEFRDICDVSNNEYNVTMPNHNHVATNTIGVDLISGATLRPRAGYGQIT